MKYYKRNKIDFCHRGIFIYLYFIEDRLMRILSKGEIKC